MIFLATLAAFAPAVFSEFTNLDDPQTIAFNPKLNPPSISNALSFWDPSRPQMELYVPFTYTVWSLLAWIAWVPTPDPSGIRLDPWIFHGANVVLHCLSALIAFQVLRLLLKPMRASVPAAAVGALLFSLHPVQVEPVAWTSGTKDVLAGLLSLAAIWGYLRAAVESIQDGRLDQPRTAIRSWSYWLGTAALMLAMLSKATAVITPIVAVVLDLLILRRSYRQAARSALPWVVLLIPIIIEGRFAQPANSPGVAYVAPLFRPLIACDALGFYCYKLIWPASLGCLYDRAPQTVIAGGWLYWTWMIPAVVAVGAAIPLLRKRRVAWPIASLAVMGAALFPVLGLVPFGSQRYSTVSDHYFYLAMLGPALALAFALTRLDHQGARIRRWSAGVSILMLGVLGARTFVQTQYWHDSIVLMRHAILVNPNSPYLYENLAKGYADAGMPGDALQTDEEAVRRWPNRGEGHANLGSSLASVGRLAEAESQYREALRLDPTSETARVGLAMLTTSKRQ